jgi:1-acyl-sn-glycerol-3-phosphate acyltransferase
MKRYSRAFLKKNPHLIGKDLEITRKACEKFKQIPIAIMTFVEGTRLNQAKHARQRSPHKHLLRPKAGGLAFTLATMGEQLDKLLDVTIVYPHGKKRLWDFACGRIKEIKVRVRSIPLDHKIRGDYRNDREFQRRFQAWLNGLWVEKDARIEYLLSGSQGEIAV